MIIPQELSNIFLAEHFFDYPFVKIPQEFSDERGVIRNIADGQLGDVAIIRSNYGSVRANHVHENDWHLSYIVVGSMKYTYVSDLVTMAQKVVRVVEGQMVYTPAKVAHKMEFTADSVFVAVSALSRTQGNYEQDTKRLPADFFGLL